MTKPDHDRNQCPERCPARRPRESMTDVQAAAGTDITPLFQPLRIGPLRLKNRVVMPGMQRAWCVDDGPDDRLREYSRRRPVGGTALVVCEACAVDHPSAAS